LGDQWKRVYSNKTLIVYKDFRNVIKHEYLRLEANFHFISNFWKGQPVIIKLDEEVLWVDHHEWEGYFVLFYFV